ncbi:hypothetical protein AB0H58_31160 [Nocardia neocaledoniensis]|uniref:hypothetical protein n=1 Tax=Nocardia neocaledoniensis TaxID=236511 RepID=UPI00340DF9E8
MPTYFHLDRLNVLSPGILTRGRIETHKVVEGGVSRHGEQFFHHSRRITDTEVALEFLWELVRQRSYSELPSRFQSFFAVRTVEEAVALRDRLPGAAGATVWEVECEKAGHRADMSLIRAGVKASAPDTENGNSISNALQFAHLYWQGYDHGGNQAFDAQLWEIVLPLPVTIVRRVDA